MRLIDADKLKEKLHMDEYMGEKILYVYESDIDEEHTVYANTVLHGMWYKGIACTVCGKCVQENISGMYIDASAWRYCPNCGAQMDVENRQEGC